MSDPSGNFVNDFVQYFTIHAQKNSSGTTSTIFKYVDVFRNKVVKYLYSYNGAAHSFTLNPILENSNGTTITPNTTNRYLTLYSTSGSPSEGNVFINTGDSVRWQTTTYD